MYVIYIYIYIYNCGKKTMQNNYLVLKVSCRRTDNPQPGTMIMTMIVVPSKVKSIRRYEEHMKNIYEKAAQIEPKDERFLLTLY